MRAYGSEAEAVGPRRTFSRIAPQFCQDEGVSP